MRKIASTLLLFFCAVMASNAQITMSHAAKPVDKEELIAAYDSTKNYLGNTNVRSYVGQLLYVNGKSETLQGYGYDNFKTEKEPGALSGRYGNPAASSGFNTKYEDLAGKYFVVLDVQPHSKQKEGSYVYGKKWWFYLQNRDDESDTVWFEYDGEFEHTFPFITISYFNYLKNSFLGKKYISAYSVREDGTFVSRIREYDFHTGELIPQTKEDIWEVIDVTIEDKYYDLVLVVKNQKGNISVVDTDYVNPLSNGQIVLFTNEEYKSLCSKYGGEYMNLVRQGKIRVGMPEALLIMSWGMPEDINRSSSGLDQWVYDSQYVYVKGGKITAWN